MALASDKIVFSLTPRKDERGDQTAGETHYTFQAGRNSGVIDLHQTRSFPGRREHRTLFAVRTDDLPKALQQVASILREMIGLIRPLRIGWMKHRNIGVARSVDPVSDEDVAAVTRKRRQKLSLDA